MSTAAVHRRLPCGVEVLKDGTVHARVWAPSVERIEVVRDDDRSKTWTLIAEPDGYHSGSVPLAPGDRYWFSLEGRLRPDPCSRWQPEGPHGPSAVVDPAAFRWTDDGWPGVDREGQVLYEMHIGTFTPAGTWRSAMDQLPALADLGITVIEMMPVNDFPGEFGWGYDGVCLYAPAHQYGTPDDLRAFIDRAHQLGLGVIHDVVYNHLGPDGNYLAEFSPEYFTDKYKNDWGTAINFEGPPAAREFFVANAGYWIDEFHFDGLRIDATQDIHDASPVHVLRDITQRAREAAPRRRVYIVGENERQQTRLVRPIAEGGYGLDALWNDDFHHSAVVRLTGRREAYYLDYRGRAHELAACAKYGFLYQGQYYTWQKKARGTPAFDLAPANFVAFIENHDQVANSPFGRRLHQVCSPREFRAMTAFLLLGPATPMLFQGQEFNSTAPFLYFADHKPELHEGIERGRREFLKQFASVRDPDVMSRLPSPVERSTFEQSRLNPRERETHAHAVALHRDLIAIRREDPVIANPQRRLDAVAVSSDLLVLRYFGGAAGDRLLVVNFGEDVELAPIPEPLLAPPAERTWRVVWNSEAAAYGGQGVPPLNADREWHVPGECALLLADQPLDPSPTTKRPDDR